MAELARNRNGSATPLLSLLTTLGGRLAVCVWLAGTPPPQSRRAVTARECRPSTKLLRRSNRNQAIPSNAFAASLKIRSSCFGSPQVPPMMNWRVLDTAPGS